MSPLVKGTQNHLSLINIESTCWFIPTSFWHNKSLEGAREIWLYWPFVTRVTGKWTVNYWECKTQYITSPDKKKQTQHDESKPVASQEYRSIQINRLVLGSNIFALKVIHFVLRILDTIPRIPISYPWRASSISWKTRLPREKSAWIPYACTEYSDSAEARIGVQHTLKVSTEVLQTTQHA